MKPESHNLIDKKSEDTGLISVIMPCYNAEAYLKEAVKSVFSQSYKNIECIVVDDGSTDNSPEILNELKDNYGEKIIILQQQNKGSYPARNLALKNAKGQFIAFLDSDDYWDHECLEKLHAALIEADKDIAYCGWQNVGKGGPGTEPYVPPAYEDEDLVKRFIKGCPWPIHAALCRREIIESIDGFSERYFTSMDFDLWVRLLTVTKQIIRVPEVLAFYRWHDSGQISSVKWRQVQDAWGVRNDFVKSNPALVKHIEKGELRQLVNGALLQSAYKAYWDRDLVSARHLFRKVFAVRFFGLKDVKYIILSFLPVGILKRLLHQSDHGVATKS